MRHDITIHGRVYRIRQVIDLTGGTFFFNVTMSGMLAYVLFLLWMDWQFPAQRILAHNGGIDYMIVCVSPFLISILPVVTTKQRNVQQ